MLKEILLALKRAVSLGGGSFNIHNSFLGLLYFELGTRFLRLQNSPMIPSDSIMFSLADYNGASMFPAMVIEERFILPIQHNDHFFQTDLHHSTEYLLLFYD